MKDFPKGAERYVTFNDTEGLTPFTLDIEKIIRWIYEYYKETPYFPPPELMDNYGLPKQEQIFRRPVMPERLQILLKHIRNKVRVSRARVEGLPEQLVIIGMRKYLTEHAKEYFEELEWMRDMWYYRLYGYWFWLEGKPTWIPPFHFSYVFSYDLGGVKTLYRAIDRKRYIGKSYCYFAKETFAKYGEDGYPIAEADGTYLMVPTKNRVFLGNVTPKGRRYGETQGELSVGVDIMSLAKGSDCRGVIMSMGGESAQSIFNEKLIPAFRKKPFFYRPIWNGSNAPKGKLHFSASDYDMFEEELSSILVAATTVDRQTFNGQKIYWGLFDEEGNTKGTDIVDGWSILKETMAQGGVFHGYAAHPSTSEELSGDASLRYEKLWDQSDFYARNKITGQTQSGLLRFFYDAAEFYTEEFLDRYGNTVVKKPTKEQAEFIGKNYGSAYALESMAEQIIKEGGIDAETNLRKLRKKYPRTIKHVFLSTSGDIGFNITKLDNNLTYLKECERTSPVVRKGFYQWKNNIVDGEVEFIETLDERKALWSLSGEPPVHVKNKKITTIQFDPIKESPQPTYAPAFPGLYISGSDPYNFKEKTNAQFAKEKRKYSLGGGCTFMDRLESDKDDIPITDWEGYKFTATFLGYFIDDDEYCEQMLMNSVYWGAFHAPETNLPVVWKHFVKRGYRGYLFYEYDIKARGFKQFPGYNATHRKKEIFRCLNFFIENRIHINLHKELTEQCIEIQSMEQMTHFDLISPCGGVLMCMNNEAWQLIKKATVHEKRDAAHYYGRRL
jgi:hypothetical protein